jgi:hypothetical protein
MRALVLAALLLLSVTACNTSGGTTVKPPSVTVRSPDAEENRQAAEQEAQRLLSLVRLPDGARPFGSAPKSLPGPAVGTPLVDSLVDRSMFWRVGMPFEETLAWLDAHTPHGLSRSASSNASGTGRSVISGRAYSGPSTDAWQSAELQLGVAADGRSMSLVRADGMVVWLDPRPRKDSTPDRRIRITLREGCPASEPAIVGVTNPGHSDLDAKLLPADEPTAALVCEYTGLNGQRALGLRRYQRLDANAAQRIARVARSLSLSHTIGGVRSCPRDDGSVAVIALSFAGRPDVGLWLNLTGCAFVRNGHILTAAGDLAQVTVGTFR